MRGTMQRLTMAGVLAASAVPAWAQGRKPDAAPISAGERYEVDVERWTRAYEAAGHPPVLVLAGVASPVVSPGGLGASLSSVDASGDALLLKREIERALLDNADTEVVHLDALSDMDRREGELLLLGREREAVDLLATKLNASLVIVARLQPSARAGAKYRVTVDAIDVPRARTISTIGFDWEEGDDARSVKRYARLVTQDFVERFDRYWCGDASCQARRFTVRLLHAETAELAELREVIAGVPRVATARVLQRQSARDASVAELEVRYAGEAFDFVSHVDRAVRREFGLGVEAVDLTTGSITLAPAGESWALGSRMRPLTTTVPAWPSPTAATPSTAPAAAPSSAPVVQPEPMREARPTPSAQPRTDAPVTESFAELYARAGSPRIAVVMTAAADRDELRRVRPEAEWGLDGLYSDPWVRVPRPSDDDALGLSGTTLSARDAAILDPQSMHVSMLSAMGAWPRVRLIDAETVRERVLASMPERELLRESELVELLRQSGLADVAVLGVGRADAGRGYRDAAWTVRAVEIETARVLATGVAREEVDDRAESDELSEARATLAMRLSAQVERGLRASWSPPSRIEVVVEGLGDEGDALAFGDALLASVGVMRELRFATYEIAPEGATAVYGATYSGAYDGLVRGVLGATSRLGFETDLVSSTPERLVLRVP